MRSSKNPFLDPSQPLPYVCTMYSRWDCGDANTVCRCQKFEGWELQHAEFIGINSYSWRTSKLDLSTSAEDA